MLGCALFFWHQHQIYAPSVTQKDWRKRTIKRCSLSSKPERMSVLTHAFRIKTLLQEDDVCYWSS